MTDEQPPAPQPIPWYKSKVLLGIFTVVAAQAISRLQAIYHVDLALFGINANDLASWALDVVSAAAATIAVHARVTSPASPVSFRKPPSNGT